MSAGECGAMSTGSFGNAKAGKVSDLSWFRRRQLRALAVVAAVVLVAEGASLVGDFSFGYALGSVPAALAWMLQNFCPTPSSLGQLGIIATQVVSTVFDSIAATMLAALLGIVLAVLGCSSVGVENGIVRGVIRIFANIFRNVPMIAWALLLLLSFKQNEFTGFLALFLATFGQITRFFWTRSTKSLAAPSRRCAAAEQAFGRLSFRRVCRLPLQSL